ncbi:uncharacterized protein EV420DRAFT_1529334 [Desarmillaria tabescens]|uniref:Uncharacterized protein n=1 Tax=Armillaria tabescens TaxID=1929756 RepID=A0AA39TNI2_ARMTA|nr:uncharacterized protein EV420DRAFT_1529334 [Desarmillaria tabescens]KAK0460948.1 hypothetical protein EV420DRAFT_1529334 [Desarmillaria tabescens]
MQRPCFATDLLSSRCPAFCCLSHCGPTLLVAVLLSSSISFPCVQSKLFHSLARFHRNMHPFAIPGSVRPVFDSKDYQRTFLGSARISQQILIVKYLRPVIPLCLLRYPESLRVFVYGTPHHVRCCLQNLGVVSSCTSPSYHSHNQQVPFSIYSRI